jgi:hypothetical protein
MTVMKNIATASTSTASAAEIQKAQETIAKIQELIPTLKGALWTPVMTLENSDVKFTGGELGWFMPCSYASLAVQKFCAENGIKMAIWKQHREQDGDDDSNAAQADLYTMHVTIY